MIGVAGCGRMGAPMLRALRDAGARAQGFDVVDKPEPWIGRDARSFAQDLETLFIVVRDEAQIDEVLFSRQNFLQMAPHLDRLVICSTVSPRYLLALRDRVADRIALIDAPMSGAEQAAQNRNLTFMLGGDTQDVQDLLPLLGAMGTTFHHMGAFGAGMQTKVLNNLLAASHTAMTRLVIDWADDANIDRNKLLAAINTSSGQNWLATDFDGIEFASDGYAPDNSIGILVKDVAAALDAAPPGLERVLPQTIMTVLRNLHPLMEPDAPNAP